MRFRTLPSFPSSGAGPSLVNAAEGFPPERLLAPAQPMEWWDFSAESALQDEQRRVCASACLLPAPCL